MGFLDFIFDLFEVASNKAQEMQKEADKMAAKSDVLVFLIPDYKNHEMGKKILEFNGKLKGAVNRYAELSVTMHLGKNLEYIPTIDDITFISVEEMNEKGSAL